MAYMPEVKTEALKTIPGADHLLRAFADRPGTYLVGGAVRDLMLGFAQFDFDVVVESNASEAADHLVATIGGEARKHERFLTATFVSSDRSLSVDIATARSETYAAPGALPEVSPADIKSDLTRRDFTVNAIALAIWRDRFGEVTEHPDASADLAARVLRVTHDRSFIDDPTRLFRLLRYGARLGFAAEPHTEDLARAAVEAGAPATVSGARIGAELLNLFAERSALVAIDSMAALGLDQALRPEFVADEYVAARTLQIVPAGVRQDLLLLALCSRGMDDAQMAEWVEFLQLTQRDARTVRECVSQSGTVMDETPVGAAPSTLDAALRGFSLETLALACGLPDSDPERVGVIREWLASSDSNRLEITGADLLASGIPEGPQIGRVLAAALDATLDGEIDGREQQLGFALKAAKEKRIQR